MGGGQNKNAFMVKTRTKNDKKTQFALLKCPILAHLYLNGFKQLHNVIYVKSIAKNVFFSYM